MHDLSFFFFWNRMQFLSINFQYVWRRKENCAANSQTLCFKSLSRVFLIAWGSLVQKCGCCDLESGRKFILEVGENLSPIHPSPFNSPPLSCTSQSSLLPQIHLNIKFRGWPLFNSARSSCCDDGLFYNVFSYWYWIVQKYFLEKSTLERKLTKIFLTQSFPSLMHLQLKA